jgi:hypothetical protein
MSNSGGISHGSQLIPVCIKELLKRFLCTHFAPFSIRLKREVVEVAKVADLSGRQFRILGQVKRQGLWRRLGNRLRHVRG